MNEWLSIYLFNQVPVLTHVLNLTAKGNVCFGGGWGEEGYLKTRVRNNMKGGQGRRFECIVTTEVPTALTEVAAAPLERRTHPHAGAITQLQQ